MTTIPPTLKSVGFLVGVVVILDDVIRTLYEENTYVCENCKRDVTDEELVRAI